MGKGPPGRFWKGHGSQVIWTQPCLALAARVRAQPSRSPWTSKPQPEQELAMLSTSQAGARNLQESTARNPKISMMKGIQGTVICEDYEDYEAPEKGKMKKDWRVTELLGIAPLKGAKLVIVTVWDGK